MSIFNQNVFCALNRFRFSCWLRVYGIFLLSAFWCAPSLANQAQYTMFDLIADEQVRVNVLLRTDKSVVPKERIPIEVKVESQFPIIEDMKLPYLDIPGAVVVNEEPKVTRSQYQHDGKTWYTQTSTLSVYAMHAGAFSLTSFSLPLSVKVHNGDMIRGRIESRPVEFYVESFGQYESLMQHGVVSDEAELSLMIEKGDGKPLEEGGFEIGQAVTLTYRLSVENSHSMLLPQFEIEDPKGVEVYRKPAEKEDILSPLTHENTAVLTQSFTYVFQHEGTVKVPEQTLSWWNSNTLKVETLKTSAHYFQVGEVSVADKAKAKIIQWFDSHYHQTKWLNEYREYLAAGTLILSFLSFIFFANQRRARNYRGERGKPESKELKQTFLDQCDRAAYPEAVQTLYEIASRLGGSRSSLSHALDNESRQVWERLLEMAFNNQALYVVSIKEAQQLLSALVISVEKKPSKFMFNWDLNRDK